MSAQDPPLTLAVGIVPLPCADYHSEAMSSDRFLKDVRNCAEDRARSLELTLRHFRADTGTIHELGADGMLHLKAWAGDIPADLLPVIQTIPVGKGIAGLAVEQKKPVDLCNLQTDASGASKPRARETGVKGSICVPMMADAEAVGALGIGTREERQFQEDETALLLEVGRVLAARRPR